MKNTGWKRNPCVVRETEQSVFAVCAKNGGKTNADNPGDIKKA